MGIRFICEACNRKLNVKSFLAGRRGVCPHCDAKIQIPTESQLGSSKDEAVGATSVPTPAGPVAVANPAGALNEGAPSAARPVPAATPASPSAQMAVPTSSPTSPGSVPTSGPLPTAPTGSAAPSPGVSSASPAPSHIQQQQPLAKVTAVEPAAPPADAIDEAPDALWYVRPPSGGQFGPAAGDVLRRWITEGRVNNECLVWREGWAEWQSATSVLSPGSSGGPPPAPVGSPSQSDRATSAYRARKKSSNAMAIGIVIMLVILAAVCVGVLIYILTQKKPASTAYLLRTSSPVAVADSDAGVAEYVLA